MTCKKNVMLTCGSHLIVYPVATVCTCVRWVYDVRRYGNYSIINTSSCMYMQYEEY